MNDPVYIAEIHQIQVATSIQLIMVLVSIVQMYFSGIYLQKRMEVPLLCHATGWVVVIFSILHLGYMANATDSYQRRLIAIFLALAPMYIILSISYEVIFYSIFFVILITWLQVERVLYESNTLPRLKPIIEALHSTTAFRPLTLNDLHLTIFFLFYLNLSYFGTGNIASVSSFSLKAVLRLTTKFHYVYMGGILVLKIIIPFFLLVSHFTFAGSFMGLQPIAPFLLVLAVYDVMTLNFFFLMKDEGSWLEIGVSISHFAIVSLISLCISVLYLIANWLTRGAIYKKASQTISVQHKNRIE